MRATEQAVAPTRAARDSAGVTPAVAMDATAAGVAAVAGLVTFGSCHWCHPNIVPKIDRRSSPVATETSELETAPAAVRLQQARGRPSPWHWRRTNVAGGEAGAALLSAADKGDAKLIQQLLDSGADIHFSEHNAGGGDSDSMTWTAFHVACWRGHIDCVRCLVNCGCDTSMLDTAGRTGRDLAQARGNTEVLELLGGALAELKAQRQAEKKARRKKQKKMRAVLSRALASLKGEAAGGLILELGVASGQSINFIADNLPDVATSQGNVIVHGFDSFEGLPERWRDGYDAGFFNRNGIAPEVRSNVRLYTGWFDQTIPEFLTQQQQQQQQQQQLRVGFVHMDCDIYSSTKFVLVRLSTQCLLLECCTLVSQLAHLRSSPVQS